MVRVGKPMAHNTFVVYVGNKIMEVVFATSRAQANRWAKKTYGEGAQVFENVHARDITDEEV